MSRRNSKRTHRFCHQNVVFPLLPWSHVLCAIVGTWPERARGLWGLSSSSVLFIVLFIVCLCWLMAQCYVRREERLPQAGHTVNPLTQPYWLTEVPPQCSCNTITQAYIQDSLPTFCAPVFRYPQSAPHTACLPILFSGCLLKTSLRAVCVWVCDLGGSPLVPLSCYHSLCLFSMSSACTPCWFYPSATVWGSLGEQFLLLSQFSLSLFEQSLHTRSVGCAACFHLCLHFILARRDFSLNHS